MLVYRLRTNWRQRLKQADDSLPYLGFCSHRFPLTPFLGCPKSFKSIGTRSRPILSKPENYLCVTEEQMLKCQWWMREDLTCIFCSPYAICINGSQSRVLGITVLFALFWNFCIWCYVGTIKRTFVLSRKIGHIHLAFGRKATPDEVFETVSASFLWRHLMGYVQIPKKSIYKLRVWRWLEYLNQI